LRRWGLRPARWLDVYADTGMISKKLDAYQFKHPTIVAPTE
jgi:hypothetical protein